MTKATMRLSVALLACLLLALPVAAKDIARVSVNAGELVFTPEAAVAGFQLTVTGPGGYAYAETFDGSGAMTWAAQAADGGLLANGAYSYELRPVAHQVKRGSAADLELGKPELTALSGTVTVRGGSLVDPDQREEPLTKDVVHNDDVIITGSLCVGFDCVNGENFGFDTIRLKENNTRIKFQDTSTGSFPSNDWQLTANDSSSGGANKFSIDDIDGGRTPFTIEAGAPSHSLYVDDGGRVGLGTNTPVVEVHVVDGDSPTLRLQQDGSSGFTPQTWDVAGNETNFFVRDATNGSTLPFRIRPGAPTSSIDIAADGDVGLGTDSPGTLGDGGDASLHVRRTDGEASILVEEANGTATERRLLELRNNGAVRFSFVNSSLGSDDEWSFKTNAANTEFQINLNNAGATNELRLQNDGDLIITGTLTTAGANYPDYVFESGYPLMSLAELADFIAQERHLPNLPTEGDVAKTGGVNMSELQLKLLEKVEELTLYTLAQEEAIQALKERLAALGEAAE